MDELWTMSGAATLHGTPCLIEGVAAGRARRAAELNLRSALSNDGIIIERVDHMGGIDDAPYDLFAMLATNAPDACYELSFRDVGQSRFDDALRLVDPTPFDQTGGRTASETLLDLLFDQGDDPRFPYNCFAILDGGRVRNIAERLGGSGLAHRCLFKDTAADKFGDSGPWILRLDRENKFARDLFSASDDDPLQTGLWGEGAGILIRSQVSLQGLWQHFRKFTLITDEATGKRYFFRFYAPETLRTIIAGMSEEKLTELGAGCSLICGSDRTHGLTLFMRGP